MELRDARLPVPAWMIGRPRDRPQRDLPGVFCAFGRDLRRSRGRQSDRAQVAEWFRHYSNHARADEAPPRKSFDRFFFLFSACHILFSEIRTRSTSKIMASGSRPIVSGQFRVAAPPA